MCHAQIATPWNPVAPMGWLTKRHSADRAAAAPRPPIEIRNRFGSAHSTPSSGRAAAISGAPITISTVCSIMCAVKSRSPSQCSGDINASAVVDHPTRLNSSHTIISYAVFCDWSSDVCRSEEHTSELQSHDNLVCRLLLEKKKK